MKKPFFKFALLAALFVFFSCSKKSDTVDMMEMVSLTESEVVPMEHNIEPEDINNNISNTGNIDADKRKIIRNGDISFETANLEKTKAEIVRAVGKLGGYISSDRSENYNCRPEYYLTVRIPARNFDTLLGAVTDNAVRLERKNIRAQDVTSQYIDTESRIKTKKELENRYKELLQQAKTVKDMLEIEREMGKLRSDIESAEGQLKYLNDQIAFSTLDITFYEKCKTTPNGFGSEFLSSLHSGWNGAVAFVLWFVSMWFVWILLSVAGYFLCRWHKKRKQRKMSNQ